MSTDLKKFLKCFYVIKDHENCDDYLLVESDGFYIEKCLSFLKEICKGVRCSKKDDDFYEMGNVLNELIVRSERIIERKLSPINKDIEFVYEYNNLEKIVIKSENLKDIVTSIVNKFDKSIEVVFIK